MDGDLTPGPAGRALLVDFGAAPIARARDPGTGSDSPMASGGHKSVGWTVRLSAGDDRPKGAALALRGVPASFARSLVQGYYVEPLLSVVASEAGYVLLPSAGIVRDGGLDVLVGRSRAGKSTLAARALASGHRVIGDDQVVAGRDGWRPFPRRLRFYPDLRHTAPEAWESLRPGTRARLTARRAVAAITLGYVRPSIAIDPSELGGRWDPEPLPVARILLLRRDPVAAAVEVIQVDASRALTWSGEVLAEQRSHLAGVPDEGWAVRLAETAVREREILAAAIADAAVFEVRIPGEWPAPRAIEATARALELER